MLFNAIQVMNTLTVSGNTLLANSNGATLKTYHNTLDDGSGNVIISGNTSITGVLSVVGNTTINGTLSAGATTVSSLTNTGNETISGTLTTTGNALLANSNGATLKTYRNILDDGAGNASIVGITTLNNVIINGTFTTIGNVILANTSGNTIKTDHNTIDDGNGNELISGDIISLKHIISTGDSSNTQYTVNSNNQITTVTQTVNGVTITKKFVYNSNGYITSYTVQIGSNTPVTYNVSYNAQGVITAIVQS
jgi:predicted lipoprotein with Yx(FWY)xxD motif